MAVVGKFETGAWRQPFYTGHGLLYSWIPLGGRGAEFYAVACRAARTGQPRGPAVSGAQTPVQAVAAPHLGPTGDGLPPLKQIPPELGGLLAALPSPAQVNLARSVGPRAD